MSTYRDEPDRQMRDGLEAAGRTARAEGLRVPEIRGKLLRPLVALACVPPHERASLDERFWFGALALQCVHDASLLHDDIVDRAETRRGEPTVAASRGIGSALVLGDAFLTGAYRLAKRTESPEFVLRFIDAVEQTVAGEMKQAESVGSVLDRETYHSIVDAKSGELFGAAAVLWPTVSGEGPFDEMQSLGVRLGRAYQMVDDLLDYCPAAETGKPTLQDFRQLKWTWPIAFSPMQDLDAAPETMLRALYLTRDGRPSPMYRAVEYLEGTLDGLLDDVERLVPGDTLIRGITSGWRTVVREAVEAQTELLAPTPTPRRVPEPRPVALQDVVAESVVRRLVAPMTRPGSSVRIFRRNARTFSFAARLFPGRVREEVALVYAYCRVTDDLVDDPANGVAPELRSEALDFWAEMSRHAYQGRPTGMPFLDDVMRRLREAEVPFRYVNDLLEGCRMDLTSTEYRTTDDLWTYTYRVAGAVGCLMTELFGVRDPVVLARAQSLGDAMQLTNILRDVGEDLDNGRVYVPTDAMSAFGLGVQDLVEMRSGLRPVEGAWRDLTEHLMSEADQRYAKAFEAIPALPRFAHPSIALAARVYQGIHDEIRANAYDNLTRRAHTSRGVKLRLSVRALLDLRRLDPFPPAAQHVRGRTSEWGGSMAARIP